MDAEAVEKAGSRFGSEESCMVYVGEGGRERDCGGRRARRGWKIEIKGRWVIAVAWEAGQDKSNRTGNRNATPSSDHERKNPHGKSPGINSVPRWLEPVCSPIGPIPLVLPVCAPFSFFFFLPSLRTLLTLPAFSSSFIPRWPEESPSLVATLVEF